MPDTMPQPEVRDWQEDMDLMLNVFRGNSTKELIARYWLQQYKKKSECYNELKAEYVRLLCEYHNFKDTFRALAAKRGATENRERKLKTAIRIAIDEYGQWQDKAAAAHIMFGALNEAINQVYGEDKP